MNTLRIFFAFVFVSFITEAVVAQTIHTIIYANTIDDGIGESVKVDVKRLKNEVAIIATELGYNVSWSIATTEDGCTKQNLLADLNSINTNQSDIVLFYYSGHGWRKKSDPDPFPRMCLTERYAEDQPQVAEIRRIINKKNAHLKLIITDCCDSFPITTARMQPKSYSKGATLTTKGAYSSNYKKLFVDTKGEIVVTSSKPEQTSGCNDAVGGFFTYVFFDIFNNAIKSASTSDWTAILNSTKRVLMECTNSHQEPYYKINTQMSNSVSTAPSSENLAVYPEDNNLASLFTYMIAKDRSSDSRLSMVNKALGYFTLDAQVITIGSDMKTIVKRETAKDFLNRICLSPNLAQINVVEEQTYGEKKKILVIHEVRTKMTY